MMTNDRVGSLRSNSQSALNIGSEEPLGEIVLADFNADGLLDFVKSRPGFDIFHGQPNGGFRLVDSLATDVDVNWLQAVDVNRDGIEDILYGDQGRTGFGVLLADGSSFRRSNPDLFRPIGTFSGLHAVTTADVNRDGHVDVIGTVLSPPATVVFFGDSTGNFFFNANTAVSGGATSEAPTVLDLTGDGVFDLLRIEGQRIRVFPGNGNGTFGVPIDSTKEEANSDLAIVVGEFTADGLVNVASFERGVGRGIHIYAGNGAGQFEQRTDLTIVAPTNGSVESGEILSLMTTDLDGDGRDDLVLRLREFRDQVGVALGLASGGFTSVLAAATGADPGIGTEPGPVNVLAANDLPTIGSFDVAAAWQNLREPLDVDDNGLVAPLDVLIVINKINRDGAGLLPLPATPDEVPPPYYDVNGDDQLSPLDALLIVNNLNCAFQRRRRTST